MAQDSEIGLLISPNFHNYGDMLAEKLTARGIEMTHLPYPDREESFPERAYYFLLAQTKYRSHRYGRFELQRKRNKELIESFNETIPEAVRELEPDFVLVIQGAFVKPETVRWIREETNATPILWSYDELDRLRLTRQSVDYYESAYLFKPPSHSEFQGANVKPLPLAHDDSVYDVVDSEDDPSIDVSFVGSLTNSRRRELFSQIVNKLDANVAIWSPAWTWTNPVLLYRYKIKRRELSSHINNTVIDHATVNEVYNRSKICLNIHKAWKADSEEPVGLNMRTFEVPGAGGFQLVDEVTSLDSHFNVGDELVTYSGTDDLLEKIRYYLDADEERNAIARRGYRRAKDEHTFDDRLDVILEGL